MGDFYVTHNDYVDTGTVLPCGPRILTFFLYLSDVEEGGETAFPDLGIVIKPKKGKALLWPSVQSKDLEKMDVRTNHEARVVVNGRKYGANVWIHSYNYVQPALWSCSQSGISLLSSTNQSINSSGTFSLNTFNRSEEGLQVDIEKGGGKWKK